MTSRRKVPIVHDQHFIVATRDTGYRSTASAVAELVDNSIQAGAKRIRLFVDQEGVGVDRRIQLAVLDDGSGMDRRTLREALQFGGSSRFDDRTGPGRFGMGLPNSSVSQAQRLDVYSWRKPAYSIYAYLDVREIVEGQLRGIPEPVRKKVPEWVARFVRNHSGTLIIWSRCDRLDNKKAVTVAGKLHAPLGRRFRHFIWRDLKIWINGQRVVAIDPLFLRGDDYRCQAAPYGDPLTFEVCVPRQSARTSLVTVAFSELPVAKWHDLPVEEKRRRGIAKGAGVSIVRANREIDCGWYFMGSKRKENYDDWWRCELSFEPELDELFGVNHSKQGINPTEYIRAILTPDLEAIAHALNSRARAAYTQVRAAGTSSIPTAPELASERDCYLPPISTKANVPGNGKPPSTSNGSARKGVLVSHIPKIPATKYKIEAMDLRCADFYVSSQLRDRTIVLTLNRRHPFYEHVYRTARRTAEGQRALEMLLLAAVRADLTAKTKREAQWTEARRVAWSNALAAFLGD